VRSVAVAALAATASRAGRCSASAAMSLNGCCASCHSIDNSREYLRYQGLLGSDFARHMTMTMSGIDPTWRPDCLCDVWRH